MQIQAVLFDLFGTLVPAFPVRRFDRLLAEMADALEVDADELRRRWTFETGDGRVASVHSIVEANLRVICDTMQVATTDARINAATEMRIEFARDTLRPREDALAVLSELRSQGVALGLVSDCSAEVPAIWHETELAAQFDTTVFSCVVGCKKPDPRIYRAAYEPLGVVAEACLYIGDGFSMELSGARDLGMKAILIRVAGQEQAMSSTCEADSWGGSRIASLRAVLAIVGSGRD